VTIGPYTFEEVADHGFSQYEGRTMWRFTIAGKPNNHELYESVDRALVSAVGERYTGQRGAGGSGVGTAADWFMAMIGADGLVRAPEGTAAVAEAYEALGSTAGFPAPQVARHLVRNLERAGYVVAESAPPR